MRTFLCYVSLMVIPIIGICQNAMVHNFGELFVSENAEVHVFGDVIIDGADAVLEHEGLIHTYESAVDGNFELRNDGTVASSGEYRISNDWINDGMLIISDGTVEMYGANQWFLGDSVSRFWNVLLTGTDRKEQGQSIRIKNELDLTNRELAVHGEKLFLDNPDPIGLQHDATFMSEGKISTDEDGTIRQVTNLNVSYLMPTGSIEGGVTRYRPIIIERISGNTSDTSYVTFHHHSPDLLNAFSSDLDTSLCRVQDQYFYTFNSVDPSSRYQLDFAHYPLVDGVYPDVAFWDGSNWKHIYNHQDYIGTNYEYVRALDESDFLDHHYSLAYRTPDAPYILFDSTECYSLADYAVEVPLGEPLYEWTLINSDNSAFVESGQGTAQITGNWNNNIGEWVYCQYQDNEGCWSHIDSAHVIDVSVTATFSYTNDLIDDVSTNYTFLNESEGASTVNGIQWTIEGNSEWLSSPQMDLPYMHVFDETNEDAYYDVILIAQNDEYGCYDTLVQTVFVEGAYAFYAPNSFTPDSDGVNEVYRVYASDVSKISMRVFNRWGEQIFFGEEDSANNLSWDGRYKGQFVQTGTYIVHVTIWPNNIDQNDGSVIEHVGHVNVLR